MRISGGLARGIPLLAPRGDAVRPATDSLRQAVFSSLGERVVGARFLDLFAGTGAYGLEAISRGASGGVFVEKDARAAECVRRNIEAVCKSAGRGTEGVTVLQYDAMSATLDAVATPDLVFIDPPFEIIDTVAPVLFDRLARALAGKRDAIVTLEMPGQAEFEPEGWELIKRLRKGRRQPTAAFYRIR